eukprot:2058406-Pleurochrysis_carterae.AAC.1
MLRLMDELFALDSPLTTLSLSRGWPSSEASWEFSRPAVLCVFPLSVGRASLLPVLSALVFSSLILDTVRSGLCVGGAALAAVLALAFAASLLALMPC